MRKDKLKTMILEDNLWSVMLKTSRPAVAAMVLYVLDSAFVGRYIGETALAGVSLACQLTKIPLGPGSLIEIGGVFSILGVLMADMLVRMMGGTGKELRAYV